MIDLVFWILILVVFYSYLGYGFLLYILVKIRNKERPVLANVKRPSIVHLIAAYNEERLIEEKIINSLNVDYPSELYQVWIVTDGSTDLTPEIVGKNGSVKHFHQDKREGKINAINRIMPLIKSEVTVYSDANSMINREAIALIAEHYRDPTIGGVSGEKRIQAESSDDASSSGENLYWKYESFLKAYDHKLYSVVGAAGELFSIRTQLYQTVPKDTLIEDFYLTLKIAIEGHRIAYEPNAYALEKSSSSVREESKRKIRISAGGLQAIWRLRTLFNIFKFKWLSFQFISHRVLRWTLAPISLPSILALNIWLYYNSSSMYGMLLLCQIVFYFLAFLGWIFQDKKVSVKGFFVPYYFVFMNLSVYLGAIKLISGNQTVVWERANRK